MRRATSTGTTPEPKIQPAKSARDIANDERDLVQGAISSKLSPAERLYRYAQAKGYKSVPADNSGSEKTAGNADGIDKLALIEKGQLATRSLASAGGGAPVGLTLESLLAMSTEEFGEFANKNGAKLKAMMGG